MTATSPAIEDYLKTIYAHTEWQDAPITPSVLAARLGIAPSSVTEMVKKLAAQRLVWHRPYGAIVLTDAGTDRALAVVRRHRLIETWLVRDMGYAWDAVHDEAEVLEHAISDRLLESIDEHLGRPQRDPHGDPIPQADGAVLRVETLPVTDASPGHDGVVVRVNDRDPALLRLVMDAGVVPGTSVRVVSVSDDGACVRVAGRDVELTRRAAEDIRVTV